MKESLKQKVTESKASINEVALLLEKDLSSEDIIAFFREKRVELSTDEAEEFISMLKGVSQEAASTKLDDSALAGVSGGAGQLLDDGGNVIDTARYLACKAAPFLAGCDRIIRLYESRGF